MQKQSGLPIKKHLPILHALIIFIVFLIPAVINLFFPLLFSGIDARITDALFSLRYVLKGREEISPYVIHVVFDDATIEEYNILLGNRKIYGEVIDVLIHAGVSLIGYDIFFEHGMNETTDAALVRAVKESNIVYFPLIAYRNYITKTREKPSGRNPDNADHKLIEKNLIFPNELNKGTPPEAFFVLVPFRELADQAKGLGHINCDPDPDGVNRWFPLVFRYKDGYIPSLTFRMICDFLRVTSKDIELRFGRYITLRQARLPGNIKKDITIPIDTSGRVLINFTAPWRDSFYDYSVKDILKVRENKSLAAQLYDEMEDSMVIVSDVSTRNKDFGPGVFDNLYPYAEIHMTVANMILTRNFLSKIDSVIFLFINLICAGLVTFFARRFRATGFSLAAVSLFILFAAFCVFGFLYASIVPIIMPVIIGFACALVAGALFRYVNEEKQRLHFQLEAESEKKLNLELKALDDLKNKLIRTITHELKNPLMVITAPLALLAEHYNTYNSDEVKEKIQQAEHGTERLSALIEELLFAAKLKSGNEILCAEEVNICEFVQQTAGPFLAEAERHGITMHISPTPVRVDLFIDLAKMHKVISNLLSNALKYTKPGGRIDVEISRPLEYDKHPYPWKNDLPEPKQVVVLSVKDTGIGIPEKEYERIFNLFYQVSDEKKPSFAGTGIGLFIVKEYMALHYGAVRVESMYGRGSTFRLFLPAGKAHLNESECVKTGSTIPVHAFRAPRKQTEKKRPFKAKPSDHAKSGKILVVDDDDDIRQLISTILSETYTVHQAKNGREGYEKAKQLLPDLIVSDIIMPEMDGLAFLTELKKDPVVKDIPFILVTAKASADITGHSADVNDYLAKPCDPAELLKRVENIITLKKQEKIIRSYENTHIHPLKANTKKTDGNKPLFPLQPIIIADVDDDMKPAYQVTLYTNDYTNIEFVKTYKHVISKVKEKKPCLVLLNQKKDNMYSHLILEILKEESPDTQLVIITEQSDVDNAITCIKQGAYDYLVTPIETDRFVTTVARAIEKYELQNDVSVLSKTIRAHTLQNPGYFSSIITRNEKMLDIFKRIEALAPSSKPFLITGETGVGKELVALAIHRASNRPEPFIPVNSAGLDDKLFSDTLFGHKKGAYTGADSDRDGLVQKAGTGTLFLDEIGDLGEESQKKLLRLIQENEFLPLGANKHLQNHARIIAATNADVQKRMKEHKFRKDLFERFTFKLHIPPLRERPEDIPILIKHFIHTYSQQYKKQIKTPSPEFFRLLQRYQYPRNVRELENLVENGVLLCTGTDINISSFKEYLEKHQDEYSHQDSADTRFIYSGDFPTLEEMKEYLVKEAMKIAEGKIGTAASLLGISRFSLGRWLKEEEL